MRSIDKIIIHCSATREGREFNADNIRQWHKQRGFNDIGYHYIILLDGTVQHGRAIEKQGAHCNGQNKNSIGICYIGGIDVDTGKPKDTRTYQQKLSLDRLLQEIKEEWPIATIHGHNEFSKKACPCFDVKKEYGP